MSRLLDFLGRLAEEPPLRLLTKMAVTRLPVSIRTKARWDASPRPHYFSGVLAAADEAIHEGVDQISVFEFGVAGGSGLLALSAAAAEIQVHTGVKISVYGFDSGKGLVELTGDYRDHPDEWTPGDYPMNEQGLRKRLNSNTNLVIGNVSQTVPRSIPDIREPIGFMAVDVDTYSATRDVLKALALPRIKKLRRVIMYFDDIGNMYNHRFAGALLAIEEFNTANQAVKIDHWRGVKRKRPFPEMPWLERMFIAHDLDAISAFRPDRKPKLLGIDHDPGS